MATGNPEFKLLDKCVLELNPLSVCADEHFGTFRQCSRLRTTVTGTKVSGLASEPKTFLMEKIELMS